MNPKTPYLVGGSILLAAGAYYLYSKSKAAAVAAAALPVDTSQPGAGDSLNTIEAAAPKLQEQSFGQGLDPRRILLVGDSLAVGLGKYGFPKVENVDKYAFLVDAVGGTPIEYWVNRTAEDSTGYTIGVDKITPLIEKVRPSTILVSLGTNNAGALFNPKTINRLYWDLLVNGWGAAGGPKPSIVFIAPHKITSPKLPHINEVRDALLSLSAQFNPEANQRVYYFDSSKFEIPVGSDEIHPGPAGYEAWAKNIWTSLKAAGVIPG
jgi:lysophospholipase L1-like esterase